MRFFLLFLLALLQGFALEPELLQPNPESVHSQETLVKTPSKNLASLAWHTEYILNVDDSTSSFTLKDSNNDGWQAIKNYDILLTAKSFQYLNYSKWLIIYFNTKVIIFPFHYHW